jgi:hypothetical protein
LESIKKHCISQSRSITLKCYTELAKKIVLTYSVTSNKAKRLLDNQGRVTLFQLKRTALGTGNSSTTENCQPRARGVPLHQWEVVAL